MSELYTSSGASLVLLNLIILSRHHVGRESEVQRWVDFYWYDDHDS
jgi:hypothetical protein